ncbi:UNVERIFIED_CONTAM: hypothetical protein RMT77_015718 [Armadillidium vulgare]
MKSGEEVNNIVESVYNNNTMTQIDSFDINSSLDPDINANMFEEKSDVNFNCSSRMNGILEEFTKLYTDKLQRIDDVSGEKKLKSKLSILERWVNDLGEQNSILVSTVEELEREASRRVSLLQEKLDKMAVVTRDSCLSLRDHQVQVTSLIKQKLVAEDEVKNLRDKILNMEESKTSLLQENSFLRQDFDNVLEILSRGRLTGRWDCTDFTFNLIRPPENLLRSDSVKYLSGNASPKNFEGSDSPKSLRGSLSSLLSTEEEVSVPKLKQEVQNLRKIQRETNLVLTQRDKHIADLQAQLTDLHHKFSAAQTQVENTTSTLFSLMDRGRQDSFEIFRRDDVIRQLLSPSRRLNNDVFSSNFKEEEAKGKIDAEYELSNNIDILASRLAELEEECMQLRRQNISLRRKNEHTEFLTEEKNVSKCFDEKSLICHNFRTDGIDKYTQTLQSEISKANTSEENIRRTSSSDSLKISKLENELSEKNILIRELQNHLVLSREEIRLKDETLRNIEQKLECCRRNYDEKEERMLYLTSQLTNLQLEVSRLHGTLQQLRLQLDNKSELVVKLEYENRSLVRQLNEKSSVYEGIQKDFAHLISDIENKKKEIAEQKLTIGTLQDALVASKINCDKLKNQYTSESDYNSTFNMSFPSITRLAEKDSTTVNTSRETLNPLSLTLPDIRSLNTDSIFSHKNCRDVASVSGNEEIRSANISRTLHSSLKSLSLSDEQESQICRDGSTSLHSRSTEAKSLAFSPSTSINSCSSLSNNDYSSLLIQSPTDSGIGAEDFANDLKTDRGVNHNSIKMNYGKIFDI